MALPTVPFELPRRSPEESITRADEFYDAIKTRRSVRAFSPEPVPIRAIEQCIAAAALAPSGANKQPWTFVLITDPQTKQAIRSAAEHEERAFYAGRAPQTWLNDLEPLGTGSGGRRPCRPGAATRGAAHVSLGRAPPWDAVDGVGVAAYGRGGGATVGTDCQRRTFGSADSISSRSGIAAPLSSSYLKRRRTRDGSDSTCCCRRSPSSTCC
jgi:hypothetical protein